MFDIYYAHHQWKYGTQIEAYELDLIRECFPNAKIFNPATDLKILSPKLDEDSIMKECLETVRNSDVLVFSSVNGTVGTGVYHEVLEAESNKKIVFYIQHNTLTTDYHFVEIPYQFRTDRLYADVATNFLHKGASNK